MRQFLIKRLVCPKDKLPLGIQPFESTAFELSEDDLKQISSFGLDRADFDHEVIHGVLLNHRLKLIYPVFNGVPRMLLFQHPIINEFRKKFPKEILPLEKEN